MGTLIVSGIIALVVELSALIALIVMYLWNWLMPYIFNLPTIGLLQAWGLLILSQLLFSSRGSK